MTAPPVETVLAEIRERYEAATPGVWGVGNGTEIATNVEQKPRGSYSYQAHIAEVTNGLDREDARLEGEHYGTPVWLAEPEEDAEFIAHAHQDVPRLLAAMQVVLDEHAPVTPLRSTGGGDTCRVCGQDGFDVHDDHFESADGSVWLCGRKPEPPVCGTCEDDDAWPCATYAAIAEALGSGQ